MLPSTMRKEYLFYRSYTHDPPERHDASLHFPVLCQPKPFMLEIDGLPLLTDGPSAAFLFRNESGLAEQNSFLHRFLISYLELESHRVLSWRIL